MFVKLSSDVVINTDYITAIEPSDEDFVNSNDIPIKKYILHMVDGLQWYLVEADYCEISHHV